MRAAYHSEKADGSTNTTPPLKQRITAGATALHTRLRLFVDSGLRLLYALLIIRMGDQVMASTTIGVKIDDGLRTRLKTAAEAMGRSPHWLIKQSILSVLERIERGDGIDDLLGAPSQQSRSEVLLENAAE